MTSEVYYALLIVQWCLCVATAIPVSLWEFNCYL